MRFPIEIFNRKSTIGNRKSHMGLFSKKKTEDKGKKADKAVQVDNGKKEKTSMKELYGARPSQPPRANSSKNGTVKTAEKKSETKKYGNAFRVLIKPLVTEKASVIGAQNKYVFEVNPSANKIEIAKAIKEVYGIKPISINIIKAKGKDVRYGRTQGRTKNWKKAIVALPAGESIKIYEGV